MYGYRYKACIRKIKILIKQRLLFPDNKIMNIFSLLYSSVLSNYLNLYRVFFDVQASHPVTNNIKNKNG